MIHQIIFYVTIQYHTCNSYGKESFHPLTDRSYTFTMGWAKKILWPNSYLKIIILSTDDLYEQIIPECYIQILQDIIMMNQSNNSQLNWEEVQGLSWIIC